MLIRQMSENVLKTLVSLKSDKEKYLLYLVVEETEIRESDH